jgi:hypothetical protein
MGYGNSSDSERYNSDSDEDMEEASWESDRRLPLPTRRKAHSSPNLKHLEYRTESQFEFINTLHFWLKQEPGFVRYYFNFFQIEYCML